MVDKVLTTSHVEAVVRNDEPLPDLGRHSPMNELYILQAPSKDWLDVVVLCIFCSSPIHCLCSVIPCAGLTGPALLSRAKLEDRLTSAC